MSSAEKFTLSVKFYLDGSWLYTVNNYLDGSWLYTVNDYLDGSWLYTVNYYLDGSWLYTVNYYWDGNWLYTANYYLEGSWLLSLVACCRSGIFIWECLLDCVDESLENEITLVCNLVSIFSIHQTYFIWFTII